VMARLLLLTALQQPCHQRTGETHQG